MRLALTDLFKVRIPANPITHSGFIRSLKSTNALGSILSLGVIGISDFASALSHGLAFEF